MLSGKPGESCLSKKMDNPYAYKPYIHMRNVGPTTTFDAQVPSLGRGRRRKRRPTTSNSRTTKLLRPRHFSDVRKSDNLNMSCSQADLNGDGQAEVIVATHDCRIQV